MVQAPVGWQCPECVRSGARQSRVIRYRPRPAASRGGLAWREAPVTIGLVVVNVIVFLISHEGSASFLDKWGLVPACVAQGGIIPACTQQGGQVYRLFTSPFLHLGFTHIGLNMLSLVVIGIPVEAALGRLRYLALYAAAALGGSVVYYLVAPPNSLAVGASGAIFGVFGAYFVVARWRGLQSRGIAGLIAINLVYGFVVPNIGWQAHIGGLVIGVALALGFVAAERKPPPVARAIEVATCVVAALVMFGAMQLPPRS